MNKTPVGNRRKYQTPQILNLSNSSAAGDGSGPLGICSSGSYPWETCTGGDVFTGKPCTTGMLFSLGGRDCASGGTPTGDACKITGSKATNTCTSGTWV
jgi:hypothetical protein